MSVTRVLAPNPGPLTGPGTNTYLVGSAGGMLVIDPGPEAPQHLRALLARLTGRRAVGVAVTHTHQDHAPLANRLAERLGVPTYGFGPGPGFRPDLTLVDGDRIVLGDEQLEVLHTPGHSQDHLCYLAGEALFSGDHVMGGSTVLVEDMAAYLASLERLLELPLRRIHPGHGPVIDRPRQTVSAYLDHRRARERSILQAVGAGASRVGEVVEAVYTDVPTELLGAAARNVVAHLRKLAAEGRVRIEGELPAGWGPEASDTLRSVRISLPER